MQKRIDEADAEIRKALETIFRKPKTHFTVEDKRFLQARRSYLTQAQLDEYSEVLKEKLPRPDGKKEEEKEINELTRAELEKMATQEGVENPSDRKLYRTNADLQEAIKQKQKEKEEQ